MKKAVFVSPHFWRLKKSHYLWTPLCDHSAQHHINNFCFIAIQLESVLIIVISCQDLVLAILRKSPIFWLSCLIARNMFLMPSKLLAINLVSFAYLRLFTLCPPIRNPSSLSSSLAFLKITSAYKLNKNGDRMHPCLVQVQVQDLFVTYTIIQRVYNQQ